MGGAYFDALATEGLTLYVPKQQTSNTFSKSAESSSLDILMRYNGEIGFDGYPEYTKDFKISEGPDGYNVSGMYSRGIDENGQPMWASYDKPLGYIPDLNTAAKEVDKCLAYVHSQNNGIMNVYVKQNGTTDPNQLLNQ